MMNQFTGWYVASVEAQPVDTGGMGWMPCINWCKETFGDQAVAKWRYEGEGVFEFYHSKDYSLFLLRWQ